MNDKITFIHIGKCGGSSIRHALRLNKFNYEIIHVKKPIYNSKKKYLICIRNPISRFISAFYWRLNIVKNSKDLKLKNERKFYEKYNNINDFCNDLQYNNNILNDYNINSHLNMDIHFYLDDFLNECSVNNIIGVICNESLNKDVKSILNILINKNKKIHKYNKNLTDLSYKILKEYLKNDYNIIEKLYQKKIINKNKYEKLCLKKYIKM